MASVIAELVRKAKAYVIKHPSEPYIFDATEIINKIGNPWLLVEAGFLPYVVEPENSENVYFGFSEISEIELLGLMIEMMRNEWDEETITFFFGRTPMSLFKLLPNWFYGSVEYMFDRAVKDNIALPLLLYAPNYTYSSLRVKTNMIKYQLPDSYIYSDELYTILATQGYNFYPVSRYATSAESSLYFESSSDKKYCGTFYYFEADSNTWLAFKTSFTYQNKYEAYLDLKAKIYPHFKKYYNFLTRLYKDSLNEHLENSHKETIKTPENFFEYFEKETQEIINKSRGFYTGDLDVYQTPQEIYHNYHTELNLSRPPASDRKIYIGRWLDLYADEDIYDQFLCTSAQFLGLDVLVFTSMIGTLQLVQEILDTRPRAESYLNLIFNTPLMKL